jgi:hypothetical protein
VPDKPTANGNEAVYRPKILAEAKAQGLTDEQAQYLVGLASHESNFNPNAKGTPDPNTGHQAIGIGQMFPAAAQDAGLKPGDLSDPNKQIAGMTTYFKQKLDQYGGNPDMAAMAYNQGDNPAKWDPAYALAARKAAGLPPDQQFHSLAGQLYQQQHAQGDPGNPNEGWNYSRNTLNNVTLGAMAPAQAEIDALANGTSYSTQRALSEAWQQQWLKDHPLASMASDVQGFAIPDTLAGKGVMVGGKLAMEAVPALAGIIRPALGIADAYAPISAGIKAVPRAIASGAATGVLNSGANPAGSVVKDAELGAVGGALAQPIASAAGYAGQLGSTIARATGMTGDASLYQSVQKGLARKLGTAAPDLVPSQVPGVNFSLPEMLDEPNKDIEAKFAQVSGADPVAAQNQIEQNNAARVNFYHNLMGTPSDLQDAHQALDANNSQISALMDAQPAGPNPHGMTMEPVLEHVNNVLADKSKTPVENVPETMHEIKSLLHEEVAKGPKAKAEGTLADLYEDEPEDFEGQLHKALGSPKDEKEQKLVEDVRSMHGLRRYLDGQLDKLDAPTSAPQRLLKRELTEIKGLVNEELQKIPGYKELMDKSGDIQAHIKELELLQETGKKLTDIRDMMKPGVLHTLINNIENSHLVKGLTNKAAKAKSVLPETLDKLKILEKDIARSLAAKVPVNVSNKAEIADKGHVLGGLMHAAAGSSGALVGHYSGIPYGGAVGYVGGIVAQQMMKKAATEAEARTARVTLDAMLHPKKYPPIAPKAATVPNGFYSGMLGGNALNGLTQGGQGPQVSGVKHDNTNPTDEKYVSNAKAGEGSGGQDFPYTRSFDAGSFPSHTQWVKEGVNNPRFYEGIMRKVPQPSVDDLPHNAAGFIEHMKQLAASTGRDLTPEQMQSVSDEWQAVRRSPIARLGFSLGHTMLMPSGYQYGHEAGLYSPQNDMLLAALDDPKGTLTHESIHRGIQVLRQAGLIKGMSLFTDAFGNPKDDFGDLEEGLVRRIMHDTMGDVQGSVTPKDLNSQSYIKGGDAEAWEQKTINALNKAATKYILAQRAKGQRVDY